MSRYIVPDSIDRSPSRVSLPQRRLARQLMAPRSPIGVIRSPLMRQTKARRRFSSFGGHPANAISSTPLIPPVALRWLLQAPTRDTGHVGPPHLSGDGPTRWRTRSLTQLMISIVSVEPLNIIINVSRISRRSAVDAASDNSSSFAVVFAQHLRDELHSSATNGRRHLPMTPDLFPSASGGTSAAPP